MSFVEMAAFLSRPYECVKTNLSNDNAPEEPRTASAV